MKKPLLFPTILIGLALLAGCKSSKFDFLSQQQKEMTSTVADTQPNYNTSYPDDVSVSPCNYITVEMAKQALEENRHDDCIKNGIIVFDEQSYRTKTSSVTSNYFFKITVPYEYGNEVYRAEVSYTRYTGHDYSGEYNTSTDGYKLDSQEPFRVWEEEPELTKFGEYVFDNGATSVWFNITGCDGNWYTMEYKIKYHYSSWTKGHDIDETTSEPVSHYGDTGWDGDNHYLSIDLGSCTDENGENWELGRLEVYPWAGIWWSGGGIEVRLEYTG